METLPYILNILRFSLYTPMLAYTGQLKLVPWTSTRMPAFGTNLDVH